MFVRMRNLREDHDLSQKVIAEYLQVHQTTYSDYELGNLNIPAELLMKLALYYQTSTDYLLGLTDEQKPYPRSKTLQ